MDIRNSFTDIQDLFTDIQNSFTDIQNSFTDIQNSSDFWILENEFRISGIIYGYQ